MIESLGILLVTQAISPDDDDIVTRAIEMMGSAAMAATPFLSSS